MNNLTNYHSHCSFCDGRAPLEAFIQEAIRQDFASYGISSHAPLPYSTPWTLDQSDMELYLTEAHRLKQLYADRIEFYVGLEIDYLNEAHNPATPYFQQLPLDYRIGSVHIMEASDGSFVDIDTHATQFAENLQNHFGGDLRQLVTDYISKLMRMVESGGFDIVGHADKMIYNATCCQPDISQQPWYQQKIGDYFDLIAAKGVMVEINTKKYSTKGVFFPDKSHFKRLKTLEIPVLVNSDAHQIDRINSGRPEALSALRTAGIQHVMQLVKGYWQAVDIVR